MGCNQAARVFHLTFYKCGSQWVRDVLTAPEIQALTGFSLSLSGVELAATPDWPDPPPRTVASPLYTGTQGVWRRNARPGDYAIIVLRDPRDLVISLIYSVGLSHTPDTITRLLRQPLANASPRERLQLGMFLLSSWADQLRSWVDMRPEEFEYVTTYRRLVENEHEEFRNIFRFLGWSIPDEIASRVIAANSFSTLTGRARGDENIFSHRRKAQPGDWRNHFDRSLGQLFEETFPNLTAGLGFADSDDWWRELPETLPQTESAPATERALLLRVLEEHESELATIRAAAEERLRNLHELTALIHEKQTQIDILGRAAEERLIHIQELNQMLAERDRTIHTLLRTAV